MTAGYGPAPYAGPRRPAARSHALLGKESILRRLDWALLLAVLAMCLVGTALVYSATHQAALESGADPQAFAKRHLLNTGVGLLLGTAASLFDYRLLRAYAPVVYVLSIVGLVAVLSPLGVTINGSHSWIVLPAGFSVQPSELAKVALVVGMAMLLSEKRDAEDVPRNTDVMLVLAFSAVPLALVMLQPDLGTALVISALVLGVIAVSGASIRWILGLLLGAVLIGVRGDPGRLPQGVPARAVHRVPRPGRRPEGRRLQRPPGADRDRLGRHPRPGAVRGRPDPGPVRARAADRLHLHGGRGGARLRRRDGPGAAAGHRALAGVRIAVRAEDLYGRLVATGVVCWFAFQAFENIGMTLGIMPVTGVPLPFVSYGGSSMFANLVAIGLLQNVHLRRDA